MWNKLFQKKKSIFYWRGIAGKLLKTTEFLSADLIFLFWKMDMIFVKYFLLEIFNNQLFIYIKNTYICGVIYRLKNLPKTFKHHKQLNYDTL